MRPSRGLLDTGLKEPTEIGYDWEMIADEGRVNWLFNVGEQRSEAWRSEDDIELFRVAPVVFEIRRT